MERRLKIMFAGWNFPFNNTFKSPPEKKIESGRGLLSPHRSVVISWAFFDRKGVRIIIAEASRMFCPCLSPTDSHRYFH